MALECRIIRDENGDIDYINTEEGTRSALFDNLARVSNKEVALNLYALSETEGFIELQPAITGEPTTEQVLAYAAQKNTTLAQEQIRDVENTIVASGLNSYGELLNKLKQIFSKKGVIVFDRASMERSGFYNQYEINAILEDVSIQSSIKNVISGLSNTDNDVVPNYDPLFVISETSRINSVGKQQISNPYIVEQRVIEEIAGTDITDSIDNVSVEKIKNAYYKSPEVKKKLQRLAEKNKKIVVKELTDSALTDKTNSLKETLTEVLDLGNRVDVVSKIAYIQSISPQIWATSSDAVYTLLKDLNREAVESRVDLLNLEDKAYTKTRAEVLQILGALSDLMSNPSDTTMDSFVSEYNTFFEVNLEPMARVVETNDAADIYLESNLSEYQLFTEQGLIKKSDNIYREVEVIENLDDVFSTMVTNTTLLPVGVTNEAELRDYVEEQIVKIDIPDYQVDIDQLQKMILYKMYFRSPVLKRVVPNNVNRYVQFTGDYNYLTEEYPSDFYQTLLKEKRKNSELYKNFYSNFTVNSKGIQLVNNDPITIQNVMRYAPEELKQYNLLSKSLNLPVEELDQDVVDFNEMIYNRQQAISNPDSVPKLAKDYTVISGITIAVKNETANFVRTPIGVYEIDYQIGNVTFYNILPKGDLRYNALGLYKAKTQSDVDLNDFAYLQDTPEVFSRAQNYYSAAELQRINEKYFGCL